MERAPGAARLRAAMVLAMLDDEGVVFVEQRRIAREVIHEE